VWGLLAVIKCIYLLPTFLYFIQDIEDSCLLVMSSMSFVDLPFQEHRMTEKHHMDLEGLNNGDLLVGIVHEFVRWITL
jgi:hypothetical protein